MVQISITEADASLLRDMLETRLRDLRMEISHTDSPRFRATLNEVEEMLQRVLAGLPQSAATSR